MLAVLAAILVLGLTFYTLVILTEEYFVPSIDRISDKLGLSSEASGATLMAMGSSAPEFFTSLIAVFGLGGHHSDIGAGTIVGSAIFNVLVIVGVSALFKVVKLSWKPVIRDQLFYIITILALMVAFWDGKIMLYEALSFIVLYGLYVWLVINWQKWLRYKDPELKEDHLQESSLGSLGKTIYRLLGLFVPNSDNNPDRYIMGFVMSIIMIAGFSWLMVDQVTVIADALSINATFLALTVLAAGTSMSDLVGSVVVAKQGRGDMAVSNAIGSNVFDILFGLGFPWLLVILTSGKSVEVSTENLSASIFLLFATVVAMLALLIARKWKIGRYSGLFLIALYAGYCIYILSTLL